MQSTGASAAASGLLTGKKNSKCVKIEEAKQVAQELDKRGLDNAIIQYQFEVADKDEETCFNDLYNMLDNLLD